jgi:DNA-binding response OmpR family regulator
MNKVHREVPLILIVDDEPDITDMIDQQLRDTYRTECCGSFIEARYRLQHNRYDLVITDTLSFESGTHFITGFNLGKLAKECGSKVIIITGSNIECVPSYVDAIFNKPFSLKHFRETINKLLSE